MRFSTILTVIALCSTAHCQTKLNFTALTAVFAQFPSCSSTCAAEQLTLAACPATSWQDCLCNNSTIQYQLTACVLSKCTLEDQIKASTINQAELCVGYPVPSRSTSFVRAAVIIAIITYPIVILRFVSRIFIVRRLWWDDWFILLATVGMVANTVSPTYLAYHGFGIHFWDVNPTDFPLLNIMFWVCQLFYVIIQNAAKFSILFLYIRIFPTPSFRLATQIFIGFMTCHTVSFFFGVAFQCTPVASNWDKTIAGHCVNQNAMTYAGAGLSIFEDIVIMLLPIWVLKDLKMSLKKRISLCFMFAMGSFACITSMMRLNYIVTFGKSIDGTWDNVPVILWSMIETYTAVICACLMTIRPLFVICFPRIFGTEKSNSNPNSNEGNNQPRSRSWGHKAGEKLRSSERLDGDEAYLTTTSTMMSGMKGSMGDSSLELSTRPETLRSDVESVELVEREIKQSEEMFNMRASRLVDSNP